MAPRWKHSAAKKVYQISLLMDKKRHRFLTNKSAECHSQLPALMGLILFLKFRMNSAEWINSVWNCISWGVRLSWTGFCVFVCVCVCVCGVFRQEYTVDCFSAIGQCSEVSNSGIYRLAITTSDGTMYQYVYCDMETDGGGWMVIWYLNFKSWCCFVFVILVHDVWAKSANWSQKIKR